MINAFRGLGIDADMYITDASKVIFRMLGIKNPPEELFESYYEFLRLADSIDCSESLKEAERLAKKILILLDNN